MTDQKPDRQDGDGLLSCPLCHSTKIALGVCYAEGNEKEPAALCTNCGCRATVKAWNTRPPTRDGAEGDGIIGDPVALITRLRADETAPPKPAPDAMREALETRKTVILGQVEHHQWRPATPAWDRAFGELAGINFALGLSAPVPPADGAISLDEAFIRLQRRLLAYCKHANAGHMPSDAREFTRRILLGFQSAYEEAGVTPPVIEPEISAEYMASLSPSPAVAAEPVAREPECILNDLMAAVHANRDNVSLAKTRLRAAFKEILQPLFVTHPVRGDREEIEFGYTNWRGEVSSNRRAVPISIRYGSSQYHKDEQWLMLARDLDKNEEREFAMRDMVLFKPPFARLSLPVQPGAGEREAIAEACIRRLAQCNINNPGQREMAADDILSTLQKIEAVASRQAPHSSSENH